MPGYLLNCWYMAAWDHEVPGNGMLARTLLDRPWIVWQCADGSHAMIEDRCPHRFVPLSMGSREGDRVVCRYHGLGFDGSGRCVHNPFPGDPPEHVRVRSLPVVRRHHGIWFWPGDRERADPGLIPDFAFVVRRGMRRNYLRIRGHYELMTDNLMDLTHAEFIHRESFGVNGSIFHGSQTVQQDEDGAVWNNWDMASVTPPDWAASMLQPGATVDQWLHMRWQAPACMALTVGLAHAGTGRKEMVVPQMTNPHIITPETPDSCHYFFDHEDNDQAEALAMQVFIEEDEPMIEAAHAAMAGRDFWDERPAILPTDAGAIRARRRLMQLKRAEVAQAVGAAAG